MSKRRLNEKQIAAIAVLSQPKRGGMTYVEVAESVGVAESTIHRWRNDDVFNEELKRQVLRNAVGHLPDMYDSIPKHVIEDGNAALFRTYLQSLGMLTEKVEVDNKSGTDAEVSDMKERIERMRKRGE